MGAWAISDEFGEQLDLNIMQVSLSEHFDYRCIDTFRKLSANRLDNNVTVIIDMSKTRYLDSSGIALLMCLNHWIKAPSVKIEVTNCCPELKNLLLLAKLSTNIVIH